MSGTSLLEVRGLAKSFGGTRALAGIDLDLFAGEVHGLLGANGSGKSTVVKLLAGFHAPDPGGTLTLAGEPVALPLPPGAFRRLGIAFVHQNLGLIPSLTVLENLRMGRIVAGTARPIDWRAERRAAQEALARADLAFPLDRDVATLSPVDRALLAVVRAFDELGEARARGAPGLLVLDEPTPFLPAEGVERLFTLVRQVTARGAGVLFISHDIDEVMAITDRLTVLRDGRVATRLVTAQATRADIVAAIVGRPPAETLPTPHAAPATPIAATAQVTIDGMASRRLRPFHLVMAPGEVVGLTGLIGSGYDEPPALLFGARQARAGTARIAGGRPLDLARLTPARAIAEGMAFVPADRPQAGGVGELPVVDNLFLPSLSRFMSKGALRRGAMRRQAEALGRAFDVRPNRPDLPLGALSGGNAQKVILARWMDRRPRLLLLDEPTQGVDIGARAQIFEQIRAATADGLAVLCASSDAEQLVAICDRVLVFARGAVVAELGRDRLTKDAILAACYAGAARPAAMEPA